MKYQPDIIISVHPLMQHVPLRVLRARGLLEKIVFTTVVTDLSTCHPTWYDPHPFWCLFYFFLFNVDFIISSSHCRFHKLVTRCYCPSEEVAKRALRAGLQRSQIKVYGLPVRPSFVKRVRTKVDLSSIHRNSYIYIYISYSASNLRIPSKTKAYNLHIDMNAHTK